MVRPAIGIALALLALYGLAKAYPLLSGPSLTITSPAPYASVPDGFVAIEGTARRTETLTLNSAVLLIDEEGHFSTVLTLPPGDAILSLTARDRFGRSVRDVRTVHVP
ncbi:MAG TPA: hypothetical protein VEA36_00855 [Candidatus Paceibacterota bacterium]|nr:hypothetical protein [Candidatus Paceibacterota bacterium]